MIFIHVQFEDWLARLYRQFRLIVWLEWLTLILIFRFSSSEPRLKVTLRPQLARRDCARAFNNYVRAYATKGIQDGVGLLQR